MTIIDDINKNKEKQKIINHILFTNQILKSKGIYTWDEVLRHLLEGQKILMEKLIDDS